ncbi:hypothetical protein RJ640_025916 [Escallonia rubra]|uniref:C3H1-type domain-containing protein n=1 Tax=Escallonia rubra TaxID=112253 RepID=A0AA88QTK1_9ASTE|nr:hypothetical protein RJ640_025916 [Escallonia rubra]
MRMCQSDFVMEDGEFKNQEGVLKSVSVLLELSASDDLMGLKSAVEEEGHDVDASGYWYGRRVGSKKMGFEERTPLMIASMFGSKRVASFLLEEAHVDVNKACGSDRATALHCAVVGGSASSLEVVKLLLDASADVNCVDANGNKPVDLIAPIFTSSFNMKRKMLELMLTGCCDMGEMCILVDQAAAQAEDQQDEQVCSPPALKDGSEKKEYPVDLTLPDIKNGVYGTDEFRMYTFKVKPCSRAYSHDWTECPFVHPGENARRRDPRKYHYSCVPCPEFRKGTCHQGDACEYAHGIFECWLHPAQYRTRLCKDETGCTRKVCFFAHKPEELRPLYASTGSAVPSPRSFSTSALLDISSISPLALGSPSMMMPASTTPPLTPTAASSMNGSMWLNQSNLAPLSLYLPGSRLKTTLSARDMDLEAELLGLGSHRRRQQQLMDELSGLSSPSGWNNSLATNVAFGEHNRSAGVKPTNLDDVFGSLDPTILSQLHGLSLDAGSTQLQSPTGIQIRQNMNQQLHSNYPSSHSSSPVRSSPLFGIDQAGAAAAVLNSRSTAFAKRSQSFIDRGAVNRHSGISAAASANMMPSPFSDWGSPDGKLDWGMQKEELHKFRKSASFGLRSSGSSFATPAASMPTTAHEPDLSWVQSMVSDVPSEKSGHLNYEEQQYHLNSGGSEMLSTWVEQYMEQEQLVA